MNSAAVIGRQLRQQNTGRAGAAGGSSLAAASARARAPSHCNLIPTQSQQLQQHAQQQQAHGGASGAGGAASSQENKDDSSGTRWTWSCVWEACKALSGGIFLLALGTAMCVVGFFAEDLATSPVPRQGNASAPVAAAAASSSSTTSDGGAAAESQVATTLVVDRNREYHLHNLSFAGPAIMGLGGIFIVAACVLTFEAKERPHHQRVVPVDEKRPSAAEVLIPVLAKTPQGTHLTVPAVWTTTAASSDDPGPSEPPRTLVLPKKNSVTTTTTATTTTTSSRSSAAPTTRSNGRGKRGSVAGSSASSSIIAAAYAASRAGTKTARTSLSSTTTFLLSPRYEEQFLPSPADLQIQDPDGCDTPADESLASVSIELYARRYTRMPSTSSSPRLFASVESDGLSDSDDDDAVTPGGYAPAGAFEDQVVPLLGRCSPQDLVYLPPPTSSRSSHHHRDGAKRFPLLRQSASNAADGCSRGLNGRASADEMVPS
ncbi:hypothetical protein HPB50_000776 [Hyalomma asiaticum]|uniref:Uncharacterized protein n=1 Tax=Hyalomma asiaticum TaxID=266040 RepID=A0ACB7RJI6_HYAAI|nr:hypothetical protein HPB50_000776 [Hyalomma asiaticum]